MIKPDSPEIDVHELMHQIRERVMGRNNLSHILEKTEGSRSGLVGSDAIQAFEPVLHHIEALLRNAELRAQARSKWPDNLNVFPLNLSKRLQQLALKALNFFFRDQREVSLNLIRALRESATLNQRLVEEMTRLKAQLNEYMGSANAHLQRLDQTLAQAHESITGVNESVGKAYENIGRANEDIGRINTQLSAIDGWKGITDERLKSTIARLQELNDFYVKNDSYIKSDLAQQKRLISLFLEESVRQPEKDLSQEGTDTIFADEKQHLLDAFYAAFEEQFRGDWEEISNRLAVYLPYIEKAEVNSSGFSVLDLGCGRGEWLDLLKKSGWEARGVDLNRVSLEHCRSRGLDIIESDVIAYLKSLPDASLCAVTGFHIVEHLSLEVLIQLIDESFRVLKSSGIIILETPNPQNVLTSTCNFYFDPTHRNPIPSPTLKFILENRGFSSVETLALHPYPDAFKLNNATSEIEHRFNSYFYGEQDYSVIGHKY